MLSIVTLHEGRDGCSVKELEDHVLEVPGLRVGEHVKSEAELLDVLTEGEKLAKRFVSAAVVDYEVIFDRREQQRVDRHLEDGRTILLVLVGLDDQRKNVILFVVDGHDSS